jgi:hypothetical protein
MATKMKMVKKGDTMVPAFAADGKGKMKTGGMVNANTKVTALTSAGSKGVKPGVNAKVTASSTTKKPSKPRSKAPKKATPGRR